MKEDSLDMMKYKSCIRLDFLYYHGLCHAIPRKWKSILRQNLPSPPKTEETWTEKFEKLTKGKITKNIYDFLRDRQSKENSTLVLLWNNDLRMSLSLKEFDNLFLKLRSLIVSTKYRYFQYRILVRALILNTRVSKWDPNISPKCTFCKNFDETPIHLFVDCVEVNKRIWKPLLCWIERKNKIKLNLNKEIIILNNYKGRFSQFINLHILLAKFYIYKNKVQDKQLQLVICCRIPTR